METKVNLDELLENHKKTTKKICRELGDSEVCMNCEEYHAKEICKRTGIKQKPNNTCGWFRKFLTYFTFS